MRMKSLSLVGSFRPTQLYVLAWGKRMSESLLFSTRWIYQSRWRPGLFHWIMENRVGYLVMCVTLTVSMKIWLRSSCATYAGILCWEQINNVGVSPPLDTLNVSIKETREGCFANRSFSSSRFFEWIMENREGYLAMCVTLTVSEWRTTFFVVLATHAGIICWESSSDSTLEDKGQAIP